MLAKADPASLSTGKPARISSIAFSIADVISTHFSAIEKISVFLDAAYRTGDACAAGALDAEVAADEPAEAVELAGLVLCKVYRCCPVVCGLANLSHLAVLTVTRCRDAEVDVVRVRVGLYETAVVALAASGGDVFAPDLGVVLRCPPGERVPELLAGRYAVAYRAWVAVGLRAGFLSCGLVSLLLVSALSPAFPCVERRKALTSMSDAQLAPSEPKCIGDLADSATVVMSFDAVKPSVRAEFTM